MLKRLIALFQPEAKCKHCWHFIVEHEEPEKGTCEREVNILRVYEYECCHCPETYNNSMRTGKRRRVEDNHR